jgi:triacylglycerol esterase/lipase EstA (alpha/beta hydrolase family)
MTSPLRIYLVPGFFGFANLGELRYFVQVHELLHDRLAARGLTAQIHDVAIRPTASLPARAAHLLEIIARTAGSDDGPIHLVGHSTGGLDARLLTSASATLPTAVDRAVLLRRIRSVISVATPHHGTPLATFFTTVYGKELLRLLSMVTVAAFRLGRVPLPAALALAQLLLRRSPARRWQQGIMDQVMEQALGGFSAERRQALERFFTEVGDDRTLLPQLTPEGMELFAAQEQRVPGPRYGSVVIRAPRPRLSTNLRLGLHPEAQATYTLYRALHGLAAAMPRRYLPALTIRQLDPLVRAFGAPPEPADNDAVVPTLSQVWGTVIHAARADHMDVMGYFGDQRHQPPHVDWLQTGSRFDRQCFESLWEDVLRFALQE